MHYAQHSPAEVPLLSLYMLMDTVGEDNWVPQVAVITGGECASLGNKLVRKSWKS